ncbi:Trypsin-1 [Orchesella cincta]|uniref:Phenoloxidase-activating factor 2 n=1 Tax=Orchesella cincta TaxID=48709 RepID=A0A1D2N3C8_ORCCI|nr:Trypsin-1 [Orchesella cincta]
MKVEVVLFAILSCCAASNIQIKNDSLSLTSNSTSRRDLETLIVGGTSATKNEFPWLVHLAIGSAFCGGSLISLDTVLTAAHCVYGKNAGSITVTAGDHDRGINEGTEQISRAKGVKWHERYNDKTTENDVALIRLSNNLTATFAVRPIALPASNFVINVTGNGTVAGWGTTAFGGSGAVRSLLKVTVPIVNNTMCKKSYQLLTDSQFCAGQKGRDSCQGDSGGPFICNGTAAVCGIVSYGNGCGEDGYPGVYTKVSSYVSWINANKNFVSSASIRFLTHTVLWYTITSLFLVKNYLL